MVKAETGAGIGGNRAGTAATAEEREPSPGENQIRLYNFPTFDAGVAASAGHARASACRRSSVLHLQPSKSRNSQHWKEPKREAPAESRGPPNPGELDADGFRMSDQHPAGGSRNGLPVPRPIRTNPDDFTVFGVLPELVPCKNLVIKRFAMFSQLLEC